MKFSGHKNRLILVVATLVLAITVTSCGNKDKTSVTLEGERIPIITTEGDVTIDESTTSIAITLPPTYVNLNWGQPGGNPTNLIHHPAIAESISEAWKVKIGKGSKRTQKLVSTPVIWQGVVYVMDVKGQVNAFDANSGDRIWRTELKSATEKSRVAYGGGVAYWGGRVFATTGYGFAVALDASTGSEIWRTMIGVPLRGAPTVSGGRVYVNTQDNQLIAINAETGGIEWEHFGIVENAGILGAASAAVQGDTVIAAFSSGELFALRAQNGQVSWQDALSRTGRLTALATLNDIDGQPVIYNGRVYAGNHSGRLVAVDMRSGDRVWENNIGTLYTPWIAGSYMFVLTLEGQVIAVSLADGQARWITQLQRFEKQKKRKKIIRWAGPVLAGDRLFVVSSHGYMLTLSPYTGEILSGIKLPGGAVIPPVVANQTIYVLTDDGDLVAYR